MSDHILGIHTHCSLYFFRRTAQFYPLHFACTLQADIEGVSDIIQLPRLALNACHSYQYAVDEAVVILYMCSINVFFYVTPQKN